MRSLLTMGLELLQLPPCLMACDADIDNAADAVLLLEMVAVSPIALMMRVELSTSSNTLHNLISSS